MHSVTYGSNLRARGGEKRWGEEAGVFIQLLLHFGYSISQLRLTDIRGVPNPVCFLNACLASVRAHVNLITEKFTYRLYLNHQPLDGSH